MEEVVENCRAKQLSFLFGIVVSKLSCRGGSRAREIEITI